MPRQKCSDTTYTASRQECSDTTYTASRQKCVAIQSTAEVVFQESTADGVFSGTATSSTAVSFNTATEDGAFSASITAVPLARYWCVILTTISNSGSNTLATLGMSTSNTIVAGAPTDDILPTASLTATYANVNVSKLNDSNLATSWTYSTTAVPITITATFPSAVTIEQIYMYLNGGANLSILITAFELQFSVDNITWATYKSWSSITGWFQNMWMKFV